MKKTQCRYILTRMKSRTEILNQEERVNLKKELRSIYLISLLLFLMLLFIFRMLLFVSTNKWIIDEFEIPLNLILITLFYFATKQASRKIKKEIELGEKIVEYKIIEEKYDHLDRQDRFSDAYKKYIIIAERERFVVTEEQYNKAEISNFIAVHKTPVREMILKTEIE